MMPEVTRLSPMPALTRESVCSQLLGSFKGSRVLVIGIGGGGDVVGALPTCFDLERIGAEVIPAGLTWKRFVHDTYGRPRPISSFDQVTQINEFIGEANPRTCPRDGKPHIEALLSAALNNRPVAMLDMSSGSRVTAEALKDYQQKRKIDHVIGVDAGGDVLCVGTEPTLESPLCDQILLSALVQLKSSVFGVFGFGADGEMPIAALKPRLQGLGSAFKGALPIAMGDIPRMQQILETAPTEASKLPMRIASALSAERLAELVAQLNGDFVDLTAAIRAVEQVPMRTGNRVAELSHLSATTLYFDPEKVFQSSRFSQLIDPAKNIDELRVTFEAANLRTEFSQNEDSRS